MRRCFSVSPTQISYQVPAAMAVRVKADATQVAEPLVTNSTDQLYVLPFEAGFGIRSSLAGVTATVAEVSYAGTQGTFAGLDQANVRIPGSVAGKGEVNVVLTVDGKTSNTVTINVQ
jgi:hypothetical protein